MTPRCPEHSGVEQSIEDICRRCDELKEENQRQWDYQEKIEAQLKTKPSSSQGKWLIGIFIVLTLAVVAFMWSGQEKIMNKIEANKKCSEEDFRSVQTKIEALKEAVIRLETKVGK